MADFNLIFMGTPQFAIPSLEALVYNGYRISAVVTQPEKPRGRGKKLAGTPVKEYAQKAELLCLEPEKLQDADFLRAVKDLGPSLIVTAAYGKILPGALLDMPSLGCINLHPSLLPSYRGAAPVQRALMDACGETGVTVYFMDEGMDTGDIILQKKVSIHKGETAGELLSRLAKTGSAALMQALSRIKEGKAPRLPQDHRRATYAPVITRAEELIDWHLDGGQVAARVNGLSPNPGAHTFFRGRRLKILRALPVADSGTAGKILALNRDGFIAAAGSGGVLVKEVQPESKKSISAADFTRGYRVSLGEVLNGS